MGSGCCSKDKDGSRALESMRDSNAVLGESPVGGGLCSEDGTCCDDDSCHDDSDASLSFDLQCCTSKDEACDGMPYLPDTTPFLSSFSNN